MAEAKDFLLEIGCEEMPSAPLMSAQGQIGTLIERGLTEVGRSEEHTSELQSR